ncbi:MAG: SGNH hydrolase domain-containing protein, partial [Boseongicola sp.]
CRTYLDNLPELVRREMGASDIVLASFFVPYRKAKIDFSYADRLITGLIAAAQDTKARLIIEAPPPQFERPAYACTKDWFRLNSQGCQFKLKKFEAERRPVMEWLAAHSTKSKGAMVVFDSAPHLCKAGVCRAVDGTRPIFRDTNHLSKRGATSLGPHFLRFVSKVSKQARPAPGKDEINLGRKS